RRLQVVGWLSIALRDDVRTTVEQVGEDLPALRSWPGGPPQERQRKRIARLHRAARQTVAVERHTVVERELHFLGRCRCREADQRQLDGAVPLVAGGKP